MDITQVLEEKREDILKIAARHGARNIRLFGSVVRGEADEASDIDLLVSFGPEAGLLQHAALIRELREFLGLPVDVVDDDGLRPRMRDRVLSEAIPL
ncbi:MAG: nucleotidyltransferase family protein [Thermodesulfobacteriota bacterium]